MKKKPQILLVTPPLTQLNTPYPATAYLKQFLEKNKISATQCDLSIELILKIFSQKGLQSIFNEIEKIDTEKKNKFERALSLSKDYIATIDPVINFLQNNDATLAYKITSRQFLPEDNRFFNIDEEELEWSFGAMGIIDKAKYYCTLYLENISNIITELLDPSFGLSRYAEKIALSATKFEPIKNLLNERKKSPTIIDKFFIELLKEKLEKNTPEMVTFTIPFPGNLYFALKGASYIKDNFPQIKVCLGGGYVSTELRSLKSKELFSFVDYVVLDGGEVPLLKILKYISGEIKQENLMRTFIFDNSTVKYINDENCEDASFEEIGFANYDGIDLNKYLSLIEFNNPMHRLWSDGCWNKLTLAHGCYWGKCSFCDTSLDYIKNYQSIATEQIVDRIEKIIKKTGKTGFHFVDEAAPPVVLKELAIELLKRKISITWWANIRFEKSFTTDLCKLLAASGCVAVSGGLEVASKRILEKINKGITIKQVSQVTSKFSDAGIMVHAYLMYGFPTQTEQETIDALEIVRQLFENGCIQSAYWHYFSMTAHSAIGQNPEKFDVKKIGPEEGDFANNDLFHEDLQGCDHKKFSAGLKKALYNYMHGIGLDYELDFWFDFKIKRTKQDKNLVARFIEDKKPLFIEDHHQIIWLGNNPVVKFIEKTVKCKKETIAKMIFYNKNEDFIVETEPEHAEWTAKMIVQAMPESGKPLTVKVAKESYEKEFNNDIRAIYGSKEWKSFLVNRLVIV